MNHFLLPFTIVQHREIFFKEVEGEIDVKEKIKALLISASMLPPHWEICFNLTHNEPETATTFIQIKSATKWEPQRKTTALWL